MSLLFQTLNSRKDERFKHLVGGKVVVPLSGREIPIIADDYVDMDFGTGALKITPGEAGGGRPRRRKGLAPKQ